MKTTDYESPPWEVCGRTVLSKAGMVADCRPRSNYPDHGEAAANAAHIVLCVNTHAQLLAACKAVRDGWEKNLTEPMRLINAAIDAAEGKP